MGAGSKAKVQSMNSLPPVQYINLPDGQETFLTLKQMVRLARMGKQNLQVRQASAEIVSEVPPKAFYGEIRAIFYFVRDAIRYTLDVDEVETLQQADYTLTHEYGDCDDKSILLAAMLGSIGHKCRFVAIGYTPGEFCHVFVQTRAGGDGEWLSLDATEDVEPGWSPPAPYASIMRMIV